MDSICLLHTFTGLDHRMEFDLCSHAFRCHGCPKKHAVRCSSFGAFKSHHKSHLESQESALTVYDLSSGTSAHVTVIVDSMGLGEGGKNTISHTST